MNLSYLGKFICAESGGGQLASTSPAPLVANRKDAGVWETFQQIHLEGGRVALRTACENYVTAELGGSAGVSTNRLVIGPWERFTCIRHEDGLVAYQTGDERHFLGVDSNNRVQATSTTPTWFTPIGLAPVLSRIHADGLELRDDANHPFIMAGITRWKYLQQLADGVDIEPMIQQDLALGVNTVVVALSMDGGLGRYKPYERNNHAALVCQLTERLALAGLYVWWIWNLDYVMDGHPADWQATCDLLKPYVNVLCLEFANENFKNTRLDVGKFPLDQQPLLVCAGSAGGGGDPFPLGQVSDLHGERREPYLTNCETVHYSIHGYGNVFGGTQRPTVVREPVGFNEHDEPGRRTCDPRLAYKLGVDAATFGCGAAALTTAGNAGQLLGPIQYRCVDRFVQGIKAVEGR